MSLINVIARRYLAHIHLPLPNFKHQENFLFKRIRKCQNTQFGKVYGLKNIKTIKDFQRKVPIFNYDTYQSWIISMAKGNKNIAIPGRVDWFATSSGTTGKDKLIPVTTRFLRNNHYKGPLYVMNAYCKHNPRTQIFNGKSIIIGGKLGINPYTGKKNAGYISAILQKNAPFYMQYFKIPNDTITYLHDRETKLTKIIEKSLHKKVVSMSGLPPWITQFLEKACKKGKVTNAMQLRPNLELIMRGGMAKDLYQSKFDSLIPDSKVHYYQLYNASEWFFAVQDQNNADDMLLLVKNDIFYEFIPLEHIHDDDPPVYTLDEVKIDQEYAIIITTSAGLWRYDLGDVIVFTQLKPRKMKVVGRTKYYIDIATDKCYLHHIQYAISKAIEISGIHCVEFTVGPRVEPNQKPRHERVIEVNNIPNDAQKNIFIQTLDQALQEINVNYQDERLDTKTIDIPQVHFVLPWTFYKWLQQQQKTWWQFKIPRVANHDRYISSLLNLKTKCES